MAEERCDLCYGAGQTGGMTCRRCNGSGMVNVPDRPCGRCNGSGAEYRDEYVDGRTVTSKFVCPSCHGTGNSR